MTCWPCSRNFRPGRCLAAGNAQTDAATAIETALTALRDFNDWLVTNRSTMTAANGVGRAALDWFAKHALLLPCTSAEMAVLSERELDRMWAFYALERHRNRDLPELEPADSREEYHRHLAATDALVRGWLEDEDFMSIPDFIPQDWREMGFNVRSSSAVRRQTSGSRFSTAIRSRTTSTP